MLGLSEATGSVLRRTYKATTNEELYSTSDVTAGLTRRTKDRPLQRVSPDQRRHPSDFQTDLQSDQEVRRQYTVTKMYTVIPAYRNIVDLQASGTNVVSVVFLPRDAL